MGGLKSIWVDGPAATSAVTPAPLPVRAAALIVQSVENVGAAEAPSPRTTSLELRRALAAAIPVPRPPASAPPAARDLVTTTSPPTRTPALAVGPVASPGRLSRAPASPLETPFAPQLTTAPPRT
ncbi:hypothetical protein ES703_103954 [subsurface metagenome]